MVLQCRNCAEMVKRWWEGRRRKKQSYTVNHDAVHASLNAGMGADKFTKFCENSDIETMHTSSFHDHADKIYEKNTELRRLVFTKSLEFVRQEHTKVVNYPDENGILNISVTFDWTWLTRGFTSNVRSGLAIDMMTGLVGVF